MAVVDAGAPTAAIGANTGTSGTSAGFSPNAGSTYVVVITADTDNSGTAASFTVSWATGGSGTWAQALFHQANGFTPAKAIWWVTCPTSPGSSTISVASNGHIAGFKAAFRELTGCDAAPIGATVTDTTGTHIAVSLTPTVTGSIAFSAIGDRNESMTVTANGSSTLLGNLTIGGSTFADYMTNSTLTNGTPVSIGLASGTATASSQIAVEFIPSAGTDATVTLGPSRSDVTIHP